MKGNIFYLMNDCEILAFCLLCSSMYVTDDNEQSANKNIDIFLIYCFQLVYRKQER